MWVWRSAHRLASLEKRTLLCSREHKKHCVYFLQIISVMLLCVCYRFERLTSTVRRLSSRSGTLQARSVSRQSPLHTTGIYDPSLFLNCSFFSSSFYAFLSHFFSFMWHGSYDLLRICRCAPSLFDTHGPLTDHFPAHISEERWAFLSRTTSPTRAHSPTLTDG